MQAEGGPVIPEEIFSNVLSHVPQQQRLKTCAVVSSKFSTAATAATTKLEFLQSRSVRQRASLIKWLNSHESQVQSLTATFSQINPVSGGAMPPDLYLSQAPCRNLRELYLQHVNLQQSSSLQPALPAITGLTSASFVSCSWPGWQSASPPPWPQQFLAAQSQLQELKLHGLAAKMFLPAAALPKLGHLVSLDLQYDTIADASLQQVSSLSALQRLSLTSTSTAPTSDGLSSIGSLQKLTYLSLHAPKLAVSTASMPGISKLTALQHMHLQELQEVDPTALYDLAHLKILVLNKVPLAGGVAALLGLLPMLQELQHVELNRIDLRPLDPAGPATGQFSALLCSSSLQRLELNECRLPLSGFWQCLFGTRLQTATVRHLRFFNWKPSGAAAAAAWPRMDSADLQQLAACCPQLRELYVRDRLEPGVSLAALSTLPYLTKLTVSGISNSSAGDLAGLTGLRELYISGESNDISVQGMWQLTALKQLTYLDVSNNQGIKGNPTIKCLTVSTVDSVGRLKLCPSVPDCVKLYSFQTLSSKGLWSTVAIGA